MASRKRSKNRQTVPGNLVFRPTSGSPPLSVSVLEAERRDAISSHILQLRVQREFRYLPGMTLSLEQAARLFSVPSGDCARILGELIEQHVMRLTADGRYALDKPHS